MAFPAIYEQTNAYTIPREVKIEQNMEITHGKLQFKTRFDDFYKDRHLVIPHQSIIGQFRYILNPYIIERAFDEYEQRRYYQKPKLLSMDLYNSAELWSWLMYINNCKSMANFTFSKVKVFTPNIDSAIREILTIYHDDIVANQREVYPSNL